LEEKIARRLSVRSNASTHARIADNRPDSSPRHLARIKTSPWLKYLSARVTRSLVVGTDCDHANVKWRSDCACVRAWVRSYGE